MVGQENPPWHSTPSTLKDSEDTWNHYPHMPGQFSGTDEGSQKWIT
jgi:hypothetical protein